MPIFRRDDFGSTMKIAGLIFKSVHAEFESSISGAWRELFATSELKAKKFNPPLSKGRNLQNKQSRKPHRKNS